MQRKTKGEIYLETVSPFHLGGLVGYSDAHECLGGVLSAYSMAPTAVENSNTGRLGITD